MVCIFNLEVPMVPGAASWHGCYDTAGGLDGFVAWVPRHTMRKASCRHGDSRWLRGMGATTVCGGLAAGGSLRGSRWLRGMGATTLPGAKLQGIWQM